MKGYACAVVYCQRAAGRQPAASRQAARRRQAGLECSLGFGCAMALLELCLHLYAFACVSLSASFAERNLISFVQYSLLPQSESVSPSELALLWRGRCFVLLMIKNTETFAFLFGIWYWYLFNLLCCAFFLSLSLSVF